MQKVEKKKEIIEITYIADDGKPFSDENSCKQYEYLKAKYPAIKIVRDTEEGGYKEYLFYKVETPEDLRELVLGWMGYVYGSHYAFSRLWKNSMEKSMSKYINNYFFFDYDDSGDNAPWVSVYLLEYLISETKEEIANAQQFLESLEHQLQ